MRLTYIAAILGYLTIHYNCNNACFNSKKLLNEKYHLFVFIRISKVVHLILWHIKTDSKFVTL